MAAFIVADSSVFILGKSLEGEVITVPSVERELKDIRSKMKFQISSVRIESPSKQALLDAQKAARETGDLTLLSGTDLDLLAKALELQAVLATDDYALQNVAVHLGLKVEPVVQHGIRRKVVRLRRCFACGKTYEEDICPVCGTPPRRRKKGW